MGEFKKIFSALVAFYQNQPQRNKVILLSVLGTVLMGTMMTIFYTVADPEIPLFKRPLTLEEYASVTAEIQKMGEPFTTQGESFVIVKDEETGRRIRMKLAQEGKMPGTIKSWELFDMHSWTTTDFERDVKLRRALVGQIESHLNALDWIESVDVSITMPKKQLYTQSEEDVTAAITIVPSPGNESYLTNKKAIRGVESIIAHGVDRLKRENITITDHKGVQINDFADEDLDMSIRKAREESQLVERERNKLERKIRKTLVSILPENRFTVAVDIELSFDKNSETRKEILPVTIKERTPGLPYDDGKIVESVKVSEKKVQEDWKAQGFIPEGPPGQEPNLPPGYKDNIDKWNTYNKDENIQNYVNGEKNIQTVSDSTDVVRKSVAVVVDGVWTREVDEHGNFVHQSEGLFKRLYKEFPEDDLRKLKEMIKAEINFDERRGDKVVVENVPFDRLIEFKAEDRKHILAQKTKVSVLVLMISLLVFSIIFFTYRLAKEEIRRRERLRELERERMRQMQREAAMRALAEGEAVAREVLNPEEAARRELMGSIQNYVSNRPDLVAKVVQSWLHDDGF